VKIRVKSAPFEAMRDNMKPPGADVMLFTCLAQIRMMLAEPVVGPSVPMGSGK